MRQLQRKKKNRTKRNTKPRYIPPAYTHANPDALFIRPPLHAHRHPPAAHTLYCKPPPCIAFAYIPFPFDIRLLHSFTIVSSYIILASCAFPCLFYFVPCVLFPTPSCPLAFLDLYIISIRPYLYLWPYLSRPGHCLPYSLFRSSLCVQGTRDKMHISPSIDRVLLSKVYIDRTNTNDG